MSMSDEWNNLWGNQLLYWVKILYFFKLIFWGKILLKIIEEEINKVKNLHFSYLTHGFVANEVMQLQLEIS